MKKENKILIKRFTGGPIEVNSYVAADPESKEACLIDPGASAGAIRDFLSKNGLELKFIINTHGHGDHIAQNASFGVPIYIHRLDKDFLTKPELNLSKVFLFSVTSPKADRLLEDGEKIKLGSIDLEIMHTPGHTPGSISIKTDGVIFTGDALFKGGIGRTDFPYGDGELLLKAIKEKLLVSSDETIIYPGHGASSTIGYERKMNPFL